MTSENQARDVSAHVCGQTADMVSENNKPGWPVTQSGIPINVYHVGRTFTT